MVFSIILFLTNCYRNEDTEQVFPIYHYIYHIFALRAMQILSMGEGDKCEKHYKTKQKHKKFIKMI